MHVLFSHAARLTPGGKNLKTATALSMPHESITTENIRSNIKHVGVWGLTARKLDYRSCYCVFACGDIFMLPNLV